MLLHTAGCVLEPFRWRRKSVGNVMEYSDYLIRGMIPGLNIRFVMTETTSTVTSAMEIHDTDPVSTLIFGEALTVGALCSQQLEGDERYTLRWDYSGLIKRILIDVDAEGKVRGIPYQPHAMTEAGSESDVFGKRDGQISVVKSIDGKVLNSGLSNAGLLNVADDAGFFFSTSDQIETEIVCTVSLQAEIERPIEYAAGIMIQAMPDCDLEEFLNIRRELHSEKVRHLLGDIMPSEKKLWKILEHATGMELPFGEEKLVYEFSGEPEYKCTCNREKLRLSLSTLGETELKDIFDQNESPTVRCEFCNKCYKFSREDFDLV